jgi:hypothetical protein
MCVPHAVAWLLIVAGPICVGQKRDHFSIRTKKKSFQQRDTEDNICRIVKHIASNVKGRKI